MDTSCEREVPWINKDEPFDSSPVAHAICDLLGAGADCYKFSALCHIVLDAWLDGRRRGAKDANRERDEAVTYARRCEEALRDASLFMRSQLQPGEYNSLADRIDRILDAPSGIPRVQPASRELRELARRAVETPDSRTDAEKIADGVKFVMGDGLDEGTSPDRT